MITLEELTKQKIIEHIDGSRISEEIEHRINNDSGVSFINDIEKMKDFDELPRSEFLKSYSYLTIADYKKTEIDIILQTKYNLEIIWDNYSKVYLIYSNYTFQ